MKLSKNAMVVVCATALSTLISSNGNAQVSLKTHLDSLSYALGITIANNLAQSGFSNDINVDLLASGMKAIMKKEKPALDEVTSGGLINAAMQEVQAKKAEEAKKIGEANLAAGKKYLEENKKKKGVITLPDGLQYEILKEGKGAKPTINDKVTTHYHGTLIDGTIFDSSVNRGEPAQFGLTQVIKGWTEALQLMAVGSKWKLTIPPDLGWGEQGTGDKIGPNAVTIFEVELISIDAPAAGEPVK